MSANNIIPATWDPDAFKEWVYGQMRAVGIPNVSQLAHRMQTSPATVARWFDGAKPSHDYVRTLARELNVPILVAYVRAGYFTEDEAGVDIYDRTLDAFTTDSLIVEIRNRVQDLEGGVGANPGH